jgi:uncharacterized surface protein with fasciclin (FAS1) repeats
MLCFQDGRFSELAKAMEQSGFVDRLRTSQQPCTILAPSDEAFQKIPQSRLERIMSDEHAREGIQKFKNGVFWDVTMCGSCKSRRFRGT